MYFVHLLYHAMHILPRNDKCEVELSVAYLAWGIMPRWLCNAQALVMGYL